MPSDRNISFRFRVSQAPSGRDRIKWFGPGLLWMVSSVGSGSVLFTPRVGSRYGLQLLWIAILGAFLTWVIIREIGRYTIVSGKTILRGYSEVPGPKNWAVWIILLPGIASGIVMVAGISGLVGSALMLALPGSQLFYGITIILVSAGLVITGKYKKLELVTTVMAILLILSGVSTALMVLPEWGAVREGIVPNIPEEFDAYFILPWIGFLLAGAAGVMWFSYWVSARGFGGEITGETVEEGVKIEVKEKTSDTYTMYRWLHSWLLTMGITAGIGIIGGTIINLSFLNLGAQLLGPLGIIPEGIAVAEDLTLLLSEVWGAAGFWVLIVGIIIALWGSVLANQDGWGRMYADGTIMLMGDRTSGNIPVENKKTNGFVNYFTGSRIRLKNFYILTILTAVPVIVFILLRDPVDILSIGGIITSAHMPIVVFLTLYLNSRHLPVEFRPGLFWFMLMVFVGMYYAFFAGFFFYGLFAGA